MVFAFSLSIDSVGSLLCYSNSIWFAESSWVCNQRFMAIKGSWIAGDGSQDLICINAPTNYSDRLVFFELVISFVNNWDWSNFVIFGDFNSMLRGQERWGWMVLVEPMRIYAILFMLLIFMISRSRDHLLRCLDMVRMLLIVGLIGSSFQIERDPGFLMSVKRLPFV